MKIYVFVYIILSRFIQTQMQCIHLCLYKVGEVNQSSERDLDTIEKETQIYICIILFRFVQIQTQFLPSKSNFLAKEIKFKNCY